MSLQEIDHQLCNFIDLFVERKMAGIEKVNLGIRDIPPIGFGTRRDERRIITSPDDQSWRSMRAQPRLPLRV